jgi:hypothetical protein
MRTLLTFAALVLLLVLGATDALAQNSYTFDVAAYEAFLTSHKDMPSSELLSMHPAGTFARTVPTLSTQPFRLDSIDLKYHLTNGEKVLLGTNGFMVSERMAPGSFGQGFADIWNADLPVFISTDAILHAVHRSYDEILKQCEEEYLIPTLTTMLAQLSGKMPQLDQRYRENSTMMPSLMDLDLFITVASVLLNGTGQSFYPANSGAVSTMLQNIKNAYVGLCAPLFADSIRRVDYSQFTVRGHYTNTEELSRYFQSMIWMGRMEFYLSPPDDKWYPYDLDGLYTKAQIQRQAVAALLFSELTASAGTQSQMAAFDKLLGFFVGEPDNVTLTHLNGLSAELGIQSASDMLDTLKYNTFHDALITKSWAYQRILSQILRGHMFEPGSVQPACAFIPLGQRFIIDSFVSGNVVFDRIEYQGDKVWRELPSPLDVMFALGNDAAGQLLVKELDQYHYASNLAALRYLIDSYEAEYWKGTFFNGWLNAIRALNVPAERSKLPAFMQTAGWWQEKMNTQLASWAELRHDNLLYAKQSYTATGACSYPSGYVEPFPSFYERVDTLMSLAAQFFQTAPQELQYLKDYFQQAAGICGTLASIAHKELDHTPLSVDDSHFLDSTMFLMNRCGISTWGWYPHLFYNPTTELDTNIVVADVHTCPTDPAGNLIGWVLHVGTGPVNMAIVVADLPDIGPAAFIGPVMSYYQRVTTDFKRLTDEEWVTEYANAPSLRPSWVNVYLADKTGDVRPSGDMLLTDVEVPSGGGLIPSKIILAQNYPNPFNPSTQIYFGLPEAARVTLCIYDILGRRVAELVSGPQKAGFYTIVWDGTNSARVSVATGIYFASFIVTNNQGTIVYSKTNRMLLLK